jgi:hypothetical protein
MSAPEARTLTISSPSLAKLAEIILGAILYIRYPSNEFEKTFILPETNSK